MILLDTHAWVWWATEDNRLSSRAGEFIAGADTIGVSTISCWETAMLVAKGRIGFRMDVGVWIRQALSRPKVQPIQLDAEMLVSSTRLPGNFTGDPADCIILATCLHHGLDLVSKDRQIKAYRHVNVVW